MHRQGPSAEGVSTTRQKVGRRQIDGWIDFPVKLYTMSQITVDAANLLSVEVQDVVLLRCWGHDSDRMQMCYTPDRREDSIVLRNKEGM